MERRLSVSSEKLQVLVSEMTQKIEEVRKEFKEKGQELFLEVVAEIFQSFPEVGLISWEGYTPYFNDGSECVYRVCGPMTMGLRTKENPINWEEHDAHAEYSSEPYDLSAFNLPDEVQEVYGRAVSDHSYCWEENGLHSEYEALTGEENEFYQEIHEAIVNLIHELEDIMQAVFGDHKQYVAVKFDGQYYFDVKEYSHD